LFQKFHNLFPTPEAMLSPSQYRQFLLLSIATPVLSGILFFFSFYNALVLERPIISVIAALTGGIFLAAHLYFRYGQKLTFASNLMLLGYAVFLITFNIQNQNLGFGLVWTVVFPLIAIIATGTRQGLIFTFVFYVITLFILVEGLGVWLSGLWDHTGLLRFTIAYFGIAYMTYVLEHFNELAFQQLQTAHDKEVQHLETLKTLAITDSLTGLYNRHHLNEATRRLATEMQQQKTTLIFFILDVDCFKPYNDTYGHLQGDQTLKQVGQAIRKQIKNLGGSAYRLGGEEFGGLILTHDVDNTVKQVLAIGALIQKQSIQHTQSPFQVLTISSGIVITDQYDSFDFDATYQTADNGLYQAKNSGRNQTVLIDKRKEQSH